MPSGLRGACIDHEAGQGVSASISKGLGKEPNGCAAREHYSLPDRLLIVLNAKRGRDHAP
jgi:hypothetical protein